MFEDQQPKSNGVPQNLPLGDTEDIFAGVDPAAQTGQPQANRGLSSSQPTAQSSGIERSSSLNSAIGAGRLKPKGEPSAQIQPAPSVPSQSPAASLPEMPLSQPAPPSTTAQFQDATMKGPGLGKIIGFGIALLLILGGLGFGAWWVYASFFAPSEPISPVVSDSADTAIPAQNTQSQNAETEDTEQVDPLDQEDTFIFGEPVDTDEDQLEDDLEQTLGTSPTNWDTDGDELSDGNEVLVWDTDPLNPDTDGDGYPDGQEVSAGYNPKGPGRIFVPPSTTTTPSQANEVDENL